MCAITDMIKRVDAKPTIRGYVSTEKIHNTINSIGLVLKENNNVVISQGSQKKIRALIKDMNTIKEENE